MHLPIPGAAAAALSLLLFLAVRADSLHPSYPGTDPTTASPAMLAFFGARPATELPEASTVTDPAWAEAGKAAPEGNFGDSGGGGGGGWKTVVLAAGVACGVMGAVLLAAVAVGFLVHARRSKGTGFGLSLARASGQEVRLGGAC